MPAPVKFAPLRVPFPRRRQTAAIVLWIMLYPICFTLITILCYYKSFWPLMFAYFIFIAMDPAPETGGRKTLWVRQLSLWKWMRDFFPIHLVKTAELDPSKNYVFGYHPHGIIGLGAWVSFGTEANQFSEVFKGIDLRLMTLATNFQIPFAREILLHLGIVSVSRRSCENILTKGPGNSLMIVVGGAAEALNAFPGTNDLVVKRRLGFIKVALRNGASLVPVFAFGENDLWDQVPNPKGSMIRNLQTMFQRYMSFSPPLLYGRGIFTYNYGILPYRKPIYTVVGAPVDCPKIPDPTLDDVLKYQKLYLDGLQKVYDDYKDEYAKNRIRDLRFVD